MVSLPLCTETYGYFYTCRQIDRGLTFKKSSLSVFCSFYLAVNQDKPSSPRVYKHTVVLSLVFLCFYFLYSCVLSFWNAFWYNKVESQAHQPNNWPVVPNPFTEWPFFPHWFKMFPLWFTEFSFALGPNYWLFRCTDLSVYGYQYCIVVALRLLYILTQGGGVERAYPPHPQDTTPPLS